MVLYLQLLQKKCLWSFLIELLINNLGLNCAENGLSDNDYAEKEFL